MRHHRSNRKFGRERDQRKALMRSLALSLIFHGHIRTTVEKAKELRPFVEKLITRAKDASLNSRRLLQMRIGSVAGASKLMKDIAPKYQKRMGGYTRVAKLASRRKDGSSMAIIELIQ